MRVYLRQFIAASALLAAGFAHADETGDKARTIFEAQKSAVVTVEMVIKEKMSMEGGAANEMESKVTATGTIISPDGLTVMSLTSSEPSSLFSKMMPEGMDGMQVSSEVTDVKLVVAPGKEVPATILLRDRDLDLAFARPKEKPAEPLPFVDLAQGAQPQILDELVIIDRAGKVANREHYVGLSRIASVVSKPRLFYLCDGSSGGSSMGLGAPAFNMEGNVVGIFVLRAIASTDGGMGGMMGQQDNLAGILLPAKQIAEGVAQAPPFE
jgi:hypothetical protein